MPPPALQDGIYAFNNNWKPAKHSGGHSKLSRRGRKDSFRQADVEVLRKLTGMVNLDSSDFAILKYFQHKPNWRLSGAEVLHKYVSTLLLLLLLVMLTKHVRVDLQSWWPDAALHHPLGRSWDPFGNKDPYPSHQSKLDRKH